MCLPLVRIKNFNVELNHVSILANFNFTWLPGENWLISGPNGSGKSTILKLIAGGIWPARLDQGSRVWNLAGREDLSAPEARKHISLISDEQQNLYRRQEWILTGYEIITSGFRHDIWPVHNLTEAQQQHLQETIKLLQLEPLLAKSSLIMSTGELRRILLARALVSRPELLLLDEFLNGIDTYHRELILDGIRDATTYSHIALTTHRAEDTLPLNFKSLEVAPATTAVYPSAPVFEKSTAPPDVRILHLENVTIIQDENTLLHNINFTLHAGEAVAITGPNGSGKTTFFKILLGELYPLHGATVERFGTTSTDHTEWRRDIGHVAPGLHSAWYYETTLKEVVLSGYHQTIGVYHELSESQISSADRLIQQFGLDRLSNRDFLNLSFGEARRTLLARAIVHQPRLLLLDEPFDGLDKQNRQYMKTLIEQLIHSGQTLLMITHHQSDLPRNITSVRRMSDGALT